MGLAAQPKLPAREAVGLMRGVLDALVAADEQGIVHRDLKPSNILFGRDGRPRVMDFAVAARVWPRRGRCTMTVSSARRATSHLKRRR
jgi:serine/threonine protein kinase